MAMAFGLRAAFCQSDARNPSRHGPRRCFVAYHNGPRPNWIQLFRWDWSWLRSSRSARKKAAGDGGFQVRRHCHEQRLRLHFRPRQTGGGVHVDGHGSQARHVVLLRPRAADNGGLTWGSPRWIQYKPSARRQPSQSLFVGPAAVQPRRANAGVLQMSNVAIPPRLRRNPCET